jgi:hypothetical protein
MNDDTLREALKALDFTSMQEFNLPDEKHIHWKLDDDAIDQILKALRDRLLAAMPDVTMNELLDAKQFPKKVATYKKMVWMQHYYRDKCTAAIASVLNDKEK